MNCSRHWPYCSDDRESGYQKNSNVDEGKGFHHPMDYHNSLIQLPSAVPHSRQYSGFDARPVCPGGSTWRTAARGLSTVVSMEHMRDLLAYPTALTLYPGDVPHNDRLHPHQLDQSLERLHEPENVSN